MAASSKRPRKSGTTKKKTAYRKTNRRTKNDYILIQEIKAVVVFAISILLFLCNFGLIGKVGNFLSGFMFGLFGLLAYIAPLMIGLIVVFVMMNAGNGQAVKKTVAGSFLFLSVSMFIDMIFGFVKTAEKYSFKDFYSICSDTHKGGGVIASSLNYLLIKCIDKVGAYVVIVLIFIICMIILTEKSIISLMESTSDNLRTRRAENDQFKDEYIEERSRKKADRVNQRRIKNELLQAEKEQKKLDSESDKSLIEQLKNQKEDEKILRKNKKAVGVTKDTEIVQDSANAKNGDVHEIILNGFDPTLDDITIENIQNDVVTEITSKADGINISSINDIPKKEIKNSVDDDLIVLVNEQANESKKANETMDNSVVIPDSQSLVHNNYQFPPMSLLKKGSGSSKKDSRQEIDETARKLEETLKIFGVAATVTNFSQGPTVTRFELQPELGVKVSRIKNLSDDIKLNLAASDIRIEAPIPGKAAIGIEVPNKVNQAVLFRDLIDNDDFSKFNSDLAFAVGKDISGKNIIFDIDKFPHLLIAGATGSGKSVCINTLIMSILYKANPDDVKLIMIDPKVVELSVYNGIPHLLLPVVTDAKKAAATLNYAVNEMMERYKKFADMNTRDLAGYNREVELRGETEVYKKLPQIVIIVDELADLIMVAKNDVEDAICRLAQLARAAGIHLIIATQRPSVDVITGLIKANMPSRIAFAVSSGIDSRTILDMGGAEELLGRGDMLFFPKGLKKPVRLQGGYVDDQEVNSVVDFLKKGNAPSYDADIEQKISSLSQPSHSGGGSSTDDNESGYDDMFAEAGRFIIETNKASIGMLQRKFKMGFNRAARVMDQLAEAGVVGPDEGTKPRQILMGPDQFENFIENDM